MCGIAGYAGSFPTDAPGALRAMVAALHNRGPDDAGEWLDPQTAVALGHARLSILDLSPEGHQPMASASGRYVIVFNGEVYNFREIIAAIEQQCGPLKLRGHSDTEVMLAAIETWGLDAAVQRFRGMFAFALWDKREHVLSLVRDRFGVKPLYYGWQNGTLLFASELKSFCAHPLFKPEIDRDAVALLMRFNCIPAPHSIYRGVYKLPGGTLLNLKTDELKSRPDGFSAFAGEGRCSPSRYWSLRDVVERGQQQPFSGDETEAINCLDQVLREAVGLRMVADVPLGAFLSGGIDSSLVVAMMQAQSSQPVRTFSIGFSEAAYNEAQHAKKVAQHLGTNHTELYVSPEEALKVVPLLPRMYDEPFADSSQIPTYLVSKLARTQVTVSLSGDGGDEAFAGYLRYPWADKIWRVLGPCPGALKRAIGGAIRCLSVSQWDRLIGIVNSLTSGGMNFHNPGDKAHKLARVLQLNSREELYARLVSHWEDPQALVLGSQAQPTSLLNSENYPRGASYLSLMMFLDMQSYLPDDILVKLDRASMAVSLEAREPLLDQRLIEFAWTLPEKWKLSRAQGGVTKYLLRKVLSRYVPAPLFERPKMGFGIPLDSWLRGPLRDWAEALLEEKKLQEDEFFNVKMVRTYWQEHLSGKRNWHFYLWDVLMFQAWLRERR